jgi:hypothetical protein
LSQRCLVIPEGAAMLFPASVAETFEALVTPF